MDAEEEEDDPEALSIQVDLEQALWATTIAVLLVFENSVLLRVIALF